MDVLCTVILVAAGIAHLLPAAGLAGAQRLRKLYAIEITEPATLLLMRHRALQFGSLALFLLLAAFWPPWRMPAALVGLLSTVGYCVLGRLPGRLNPALCRVWWIDLWLSAGLALVLLHETRMLPMD